MLGGFGVEACVDRVWSNVFPSPLDVAASPSVELSRGSRFPARGAGLACGRFCCVFPGIETAKDYTSLPLSPVRGDHAPHGDSGESIIFTATFEGKYWYEGFVKPGEGHFSWYLFLVIGASIFSSAYLVF